MTDADSHAYLIDLERGRMYVVDVSNPASPAQVGEAKIPDFGDNGRAVFIQDNLAYVADPGLTIVDISSPHAPVVRHQGAGYAHDVFVVGSQAYLVGPDEDWTGYFVVYDVSDPVNPKMVSRISTPGIGVGVAVSGKFAFVAQAARDDKGIFSVIDLNP